MSSTLRPPILDAALRSGLLSSPELDKVTRVMDLSTSHTDQDVAARLVEKQVLTRFQADQLLAGKAEECVLAGRYRLLQPLGAGGMGSVYKAVDTKLDRVVALKVMSPQHVSNAEAVERFRREAKALARVSHPGIVQAFDTDEDRGQQFLVMEYVEGHSLLRVQQELGRLPATLAADYIYQAAVALHHAHGRGLIHRDIKPANMLLTPERRVKLLDLGLARFVQDQLGDSGLTRIGVGMGTPDYMAPEQFRDAHSADPRSDIYALGCSLYHLLTGHVPFPGSSLSEKATSHEAKEPPPIQVRCPDAPAGLVSAVQKMLAKQPAARFQTMAEVGEALAPYVASDSVYALKLAETVNWQGSQLSFALERSTPPGRSLRRLLVATAAGLLVISGLVILGLLLPGWLTGPSESGNDGAGSVSMIPPPVVEAGVLTVSKDANDGGQFRTIGEALAKARPGVTIRILDAAVYSEFIHLRDRSRHEGLTIEAPRRAMLDSPADAKVGLLILNVPRVTVRGLSLRLGAQGGTAFGVGGLSPGVVFEDVTCTAATPLKSTGGTLDGLALSATDEPVQVRRCRFAGIGNGIEVLGQNLATNRPLPCRRFVIRDNDFGDCVVGIWALGHLREAAIMGNRFWNWGESALRLAKLSEGSGQLLIANNSFRGLHRCLEIIESTQGLDAVEICGNVMLAEAGLDMVWSISEGKPSTSWRLDHNWRQTRRPSPGTAEAQEWIHSSEDRFVDHMPLNSLDPQHAGFLRPEKDSPLATGGAGGDLPAYAGAVPPEGVEAWDWGKTWDARRKKTLKNPMPPEGK